MCVKTRYNTAVIGCGRIAYFLENDLLRKKPCTHIGTILLSERLNLTSVCDINDFKLQKFYTENRNLKVDYYSDWKKTLHNKNIDVVVISSSTSSHIEILEYIMENPANIKAVICEKPISHEISRLKKISRKIKKNKISIYLNHTRRFNFNYQRVKEIIKKEILGKILRIEGKIFAGSQNFYPKPDTLLLHDGTHLIDTVFYITDFYPEKIKIDYYQNNQTFSGVKIKYNIDQCTDVSLVFRCDTDYFYFDIEIFLENGKICVGNGRFEVFKSDKSVSFDGFREIY
ncbi:MAG: Gfo/Idh/MocA family oxidoreductase, partial [Candidatus Muiribacteriota bacterium]